MSKNRSSSSDNSESKRQKVEPQTQEFSSNDEIEEWESSESSSSSVIPEGPMCIICSYMNDANEPKESECELALPETYCRYCGVGFCAAHLAYVVPNFKELCALDEDNSIMTDCARCHVHTCKYGMLGDPGERIHLSFNGPVGQTPYVDSCIISTSERDEHGRQKICDVGDCKAKFCSMECLSIHAPECTFCYERFHPVTRNNCCEVCIQEIEEEDVVVEPCDGEEDKGQ